jgi:hypothetical protein
MSIGSGHLAAANTSSRSGFAPQKQRATAEEIHGRALIAWRHVAQDWYRFIVARAAVDHDVELAWCQTAPPWARTRLPRQRAHGRRGVALLEKPVCSFDH